MGSSPFEVSLADIRQARSVLSKYLPESPLLLNGWLSKSFSCEIYLKMENMQPIGSFKIRGATYRISRLTPAERRRGVIAASAGNHAQGVAWGSRELGVNALIVMPRGAALTKVQNTRALGADIVFEGETFDEAYQAARRLARKTRRVFVPAFEDRDVIAGQGTLGLEILEQLPSVDYVLGSIGGGGLMSGVSLVMKELSPKTTLVGCQATGADSMFRSLRKGRPVRLEAVDTFADGVAMSRASPEIFKILRPRLDRCLEADDEMIASAVLTLLEKAKIVAEGAGAIPLAVLDRVRKQIRGRKVVLIVSGGNIDVNVLARIIDRGLIRSGRRVRVNVSISDRPGSLARLTELIAQQGASVLQAIHDRNEPSTSIDETEVAFTLETRGPEHSKALLQALRRNVLRMELAH